MSEHILQNLMQLFAIISRINGQDNNERVVVEQFLYHRLNLEEADTYLAMYDDYLHNTKGKITVADNSKMLRICTAINEELTGAQKYAILMYLFVLVSADNHVDQQEREFLQSVADVFNIEQGLYNRIEHFCIDQDLDQVEDDLFLIVDANKDKVYTKTKHLYRSHLEGFLCFMQIPDLKIFLVKYVGHSDYHLNGQLLEYNRPATFRIDSSIRGDHFAPLYYSDVSAQFTLPNSKKTELYFEAENITYTLVDGRTLIHPVNLSEKNQSLVAVMGPSGCGKSTLMEILNGIRKPSTGQVRINGMNLHENAGKTLSLIGYVPQDDLLIEELTVFENLYYAAKLCYGHYNEAQLIELVNQTLSDLGLSEIASFKVGNPLQKVISGGERKRVNIGLELLRKPQILFVDEPTSGLSSRDSQNIVGILKDLTLQGKIIFTVIHQPSSDIYKLFDKLLILDVGGYPIYYGHPLEAVTYFRTIINQINREKVVCTECGNVNNEQIFEIIEARTVNEHGRFTKNRKITPKQWNKLFKENTQGVKFLNKKEPIYGEQQIANSFKQFLIFTLRDLKSKLANRQYMAINLLQAPFLALLLGGIHRYSPGETYSFSDNENVPIYLFISIITALFMGLVVAAEEIFKDRKIVKRERFLNLSKSSYLFSKLVILFSFSAIQTFVFVYIGNSLLEIEGVFWQMWLILFSASCFANVLGLNISASFNSAVTIYIFIPLLLIPQLVLGGVVIDFDKMNDNFKFTESSVPLLGDFMVSRWAFEAIIVMQFTENPYGKHHYEIDKESAQFEYKKLYYFPILKNHYRFVSEQWNTKDLNRKAEVRQRLLILYKCLKEESTILPEFGNIKLPLPDLQLKEEQLELYSEALDDLESIYSRRMSKALDKKLDLDENLAKELGSYEKLVALKKDYFNEMISKVVKKMDVHKRVLQEKDRILPLVYPIYMPPYPQHVGDYRARLFTPVKHFGGVYLKTQSFNVLVIWLMTTFLFLTLYYDILPRFIRWIEGKRSTK